MTEGQSQATVVHVDASGRWGCARILLWVFLIGVVLPGVMFVGCMALGLTTAVILPGVADQIEETDEPVIDFGEDR